VIPATKSALMLPARNGNQFKKGSKRCSDI
jgi:hypothetical protein